MGARPSLAGIGCDMPLYEYECVKCANRFEALVRTVTQGTGESLLRCPACHGDQLTRLISAFAVSSADARKVSFAKAKQANAKVLREKAVAYEEQVRHHHDDHH